MNPGDDGDLCDWLLVDLGLRHGDLLSRHYRSISPIAKAISLDPVGKDSEQEVASEMLWCCPTKFVLPMGPQSLQIESAQECNLLFDCLPLK